MRGSLAPGAIKADSDLGLLCNLDWQINSSVDSLEESVPPLPKSALFYAKGETYCVGALFSPLPRERWDPAGPPGLPFSTGKFAFPWKVRNSGPFNLSWCSYGGRAKGRTRDMKHQLLG